MAYLSLLYSRHCAGCDVGLITLSVPTLKKAPAIALCSNQSNHSRPIKTKRRGFHSNVRAEQVKFTLNKNLLDLVTRMP